VKRNFASALVVLGLWPCGCTASRPVGIAHSLPAHRAPKAVETPSRKAIAESLRDAYLLKFERHGLKFPTAKAEVVLLDSTPFSAGIGHNAAYFELPGLYDALSATARLFGAEIGRSPDELRALAPLSLGAVALAYYDFDRKSLVLRDDADARTLSLDEVVPHELAHAYQDQAQGGLQRYILEHRATPDALRAAHSVLEGEATLLAEAITLANRGLGLELLKPDMLDPTVGRLTSGEGYSLIYEAGRRFLLSQYGKQGLTGILTGFHSPPTSTEQLLHPEKFNQDLPRTVALPEVSNSLSDVPMLFDGSLGEMLLYNRLLPVTKDLYGARLATTGWDGDRLRVFRFPNGNYGLSWRFVWDRPKDAEQFRQFVSPLLPGNPLCSLRVNRNVLDLAFAETPREAELLKESIALYPQNEALDLADAASTAKAESVYERTQAQRPRVIDLRWVWPALGLSFDVPESFFYIEMRGVDLLTMMPVDGFANNISVTYEQDLYFGNLTRYVADQKHSFATSSQLWLGSREVVAGGNHGVVIETLVEEDGNPAHVFVLSIPRNNGLLVSVTVATGKGQRQLGQDLIQSIAKSLVFRDEPSSY